MPAIGNPDIAEGYRDILSTNYLGTASMVVLIYDHLLTFSDEVSYIWKRRKGTVGILFLINRYLTPLGFIINMVAYLSPYFVGKTCDHFVRYEGAFTTVSLAIVEFMMIIRIHALYGSHKGVTSFVSVLLLVQVCVQAWLLSGARAVPHIFGENDCTMIFASKVGAWGSAYAWMPLLFDTAVLALTLYKTISVVQAGAAGSVVKTFVKDGLLYYSVIFSVNLVFAIMLVAAPDGIKGIAAQFEQLLTVTMMSRITINLKKESRPEDDENLYSTVVLGPRSMSYRTIGNSRFTPSKKKSDVFPSPRGEGFELSIMVDKEVTVH